MGRNKIPIDTSPEAWGKLVMYYASILPMSEEAIADVLEMSLRTLTTRYKKEIKKGRALGRKNLSDWQWQNAKKGNVVMQIWLGKNYADQTDKTEVKIPKGGIEIKLNYALPPKKE